MNRTLSCLVVSFAFAILAVFAQAEEPKGPFARGEKLPGDLTDILDGDKSGQISDAEVKAAIEEFQKEANAPRKTERGQKVLAALDSNKDGKLDQAEAVDGAVAARMQNGGASKAVADIFRRLDGDSNGFITAQEYAKLQAIVSLVNPDAVGQLGDLFKGLDTNGDLAISFVESQLAADLFAQNGGFQQNAAFGGVGPAVDPPASQNPKIKAFVDATFAKRDRNEDGSISTAESRRDPALRREFDAADASGDGNLSPDELYDYLVRKFSGGQ